LQSDAASTLCVCSLRTTIGLELQRLWEEELLLVGDRHLYDLNEETLKPVLTLAVEPVEIRTRQSLIQGTVTNGTSVCALL
jgi:hypothetical protein